jgi:4-amino-4-deoxy-L-arabinose transferase-like glycosyltransferase
MSRAAPARSHEGFAGLAMMLVWLAGTAWMRPLSLPDEGRYVGVAWEMLRSGDWLTPTLDGLPFFHKPPLFYWITAASLALFGTHEWAGRVASLLGAFATAIALVLFVRRWLGLPAARAGLLVLLTQPLFFVGAQFANLDMLVAACISVTIVLLAHVALCADRGEPAPAALRGAYVAAGLGVLAKGLIGVLIPALVIVAWLLLTRRPARLRTLLSAGGLALLLAVALPWFVAMHLRHAEFLHYFVVVQHFQRFAAGGFNNEQPFWFFPAVLLVLGLPWTLWLPAWRRRAPAADAAQASIRVLMLVWAVVVVGFFSLPRSKLIGYVLPAVPALAVLIAEAAAWPAPRLRRASVIVAVLLCLGSVVAVTLTPRPSSRALAQSLRAQWQPGDRVIFAGGYFYDLPFYARLERPVAVVEDWRDPDIARRDNWRKELVDAARFAVDGGAAVLTDANRFDAGPCARANTWIVATSAAATRYRLAERARPVATSGDNGLWRIAPPAINAPDCPGTPSVD